jgi:hypothetical protein
MSNQNKNYLNQYLVNQLTEVTMEIHKLSTQSPANELEVWKTNGYYNGLVFRRDWLQIQIDESIK